MTRYRLKKDLPGLKAGAIFECEAGDWYRSGDGVYQFHSKHIKRFTDWFEEIEEQSNIETVLNKLEEVTRALRLILPMSKGYASANDVGNNAKIVREAQELVFDLDVDSIRKELKTTT